MANELRRVPGSFIPDGESIGDEYHAFDLLEYGGENLRPLPYRIRLARLIDLLLLARRGLQIYQAGRDGVHDPAKDRTVAAVAAGEPRGHRVQAIGCALRAGQAQQRRAAVEVQVRRHGVGGRCQDQCSAQRGGGVCFKGRSLVSCGNVTIPANHEIPQVGAVVEVRYLYAFGNSLALYQPVYLGPRDDVDPGECLVSQLKFKAE